MPRLFQEVENASYLWFVHACGIDEKAKLSDFQVVAELNQILGAVVVIGKHKVHRFVVRRLPIQKLDRNKDRIFDEQLQDSQAQFWIRRVSMQA